MEIKIEVSRDGRSWFKVYQTTNLKLREISELVNRILLNIVARKDGE